MPWSWGRGCELIHSGRDDYEVSMPGCGAPLDKDIRFYSKPSNRTLNKSSIWPTKESS